MSNLSPKNATLEAKIAPHGAPSGVFYQFQIVYEPSEYASEINCPIDPPSGYSACVGPQGSDPRPIGFLASGGGPQTVSLDLSSAGVTLQPGTTYHYRVLAADRRFSEDTVEWEAPTVSGADQEFTTPEYPAPTVTTSASVTNIEQTTARAGGTVNPNLGDVTVCKVEYGTTTSYGSEKACEWLPGEGNSPVPGTAALSGLAIDTTYHYRLVATNAGGTSKGADQTFTTRPYYCAFSGGSGTCSGGGGPGNPKPKPRACKKGEVKRHGKCAKKPHCRHHKHNSRGDKKHREGSAHKAGRCTR